MFQYVDDALIATLREGLAQYVNKDEVTLGTETQRKKSVAVICVGFSLDEAGAGGITGTRFEEVTETFAADGACTEYRLTKQPVRKLLAVESPAGTPKVEITDYIFDLAKGTVRFRKAPGGGKTGVRVRYDIPRAVAEVRSLRFAMSYRILARSPGVREREDMTVGIVTTLQQAKDRLKTLGIEDLQLVRAHYDLDPADLKGDVWTVEYNVLAKLDIETPVAPVERVEVTPMER